MVYLAANDDGAVGNQGKRMPLNDDGTVGNQGKKMPLNEDDAEENHTKLIVTNCTLLPCPASTATGDDTG